MLSNSKHPWSTIKIIPTSTKLNRPHRPHEWGVYFELRIWGSEGCEEGGEGVKLVNQTVSTKKLV